MTGKKLPATFSQLVCIVVHGWTCLPIVEFLVGGLARTKLASTACDGRENEEVFPCLHGSAPHIIGHDRNFTTFRIFSVGMGVRPGKRCCFAPGSPYSRFLLMLSSCLHFHPPGKVPFQNGEEREVLWKELLQLVEHT